MEWIEQVQRDLGGPVVAFAAENWILLVVVSIVGAWWLYNGLLASRTVTEGEIVVGEDESTGNGGGYGTD
jgi:hypothetical protein